jgi:hypothetical protein
MAGFSGNADLERRADSTVGPNYATVRASLTGKLSPVSPHGRFCTLRDQAWCLNVTG